MTGRLTTRAAARPPWRHVKARVRAATLPASYTTTRDTTARRGGLSVLVRRAKNDPFGMGRTA
jgi:hypothetical protein